MDLLRKTFIRSDYHEESFPTISSNQFEGFAAFEEFNTNSPITFPDRSFIQEPFKELKESRIRDRYFLERLVGKLWLQDLPGKKHAEQYLRHQHRHNCRPNTIRNSYTAIEGFLKFIKKGGRSRIEDIDRWDLEAFIEHEQDRGMKLSTVRTRLAVLKAFVRFLIEGKILHSDVLPWKLNIKPPEVLPRAMDPDDVKRLLAVKANVRDRAMILLLLRTGMRIGELLNTRVHDVNLKEKKILIYEAEKNHTGRVVFFSKDARDALKAWLKKRKQSIDFIFYGNRKKALSYAAARIAFVKYLEYAELTGKGYTLHSLRHTYATDLINAGIPLECLEKLLGHTSLEVTRRYARLTDKTREEEYFKAMAIIERREADGHYGCDRELQAVLEKTQLLPSHSEELLEHP